MKRIFVPTRSGSDWQRLLAKPDLQWKSGRSAMSAAACWEESEPSLPKDIVDVLEASADPAIIGLTMLAAIPEWETDLPGGKRPSQTDILALASNEQGLVVLGVEAKVDEPFGPAIGEKRKGASAGQLERLAFLEKILGCKEPMEDAIRYQFLHRTASALLTAREFHARTAVMMVQTFCPNSSWREDFDTFVAAVNARDLTPDLYELPLDGDCRLLIGWSRGDQQFLTRELPPAM